MLSNSAASFIHDGLCAAFDVDPKGEPMTAEQHTSIAHSDGNTPRVDGELMQLIELAHEAGREVCELEHDSTREADHLIDTVGKQRRLAITVSRRLARPTPDQIRAAVYANCLGSSEVDDITKAIVSLFDAEVKL